MITMDKLIASLEKLNWHTIELMKEKLFQKEYNDASYIKLLNDIFQDELNFVNSRKDELKLKVASFPAIKTIEDFNFSFQECINQNKIKDLCTLRFIDEHKNIVFLGNSRCW